ncbi:MAG: lysophospholipid acyltransferase family protein [Phycisphaerae bacterium]|nr:lysophospholipid acyltransferase family protein [Phycisphaerae bacterium]
MTNPSDKDKAATPGRRPGFIGRLHHAYYMFMRQGCWWSFILGLKGRTFGHRIVPRRGGVLLVSNHQSYFDPMLATLALPRQCSYMARENLFKNPAFRVLIESLNAFPVRRGEADLRAIKETLRRLRDGYAVLLFPEGTRSATGIMGEIQPGIALLAQRAKVPVVPVAIDGACDVWPKGAKFFRGGSILVKYGQPFPATQVATMPAEELVAACRLRIQVLLDELRAIRRRRRDC